MCEFSLALLSSKEHLLRVMHFIKLVSDLSSNPYGVYLWAARVQNIFGLYDKLSIMIENCLMILRNGSRLDLFEPGEGLLVCNVHLWVKCEKSRTNFQVLEFLGHICQNQIKIQLCCNLRQ